MVVDGALTAYFGLCDEYCDFVGSLPLTGRGGRSASPQAGALTLLAESFDLVLTTVTKLVPLEYVDPPDAEEFDSIESLLISCSEGRRDGREGGGKEGCRVGKGGGGGLTRFALSAVGRMMVGGGRSPSFLIPFG